MKKAGDNSFSKESKKLLIVVIILLFVGVIFGIFQNKFGDITGSAVNEIEKDSLFNVNIDIPPSFKEIKKGDKLLTSIKLVNLGSDKRIDVTLDYSIKNNDGKSVLSQSETVAVETQANLVRYFSLPSNVETGEYNINTILSYKNKVARAKNSFSIVDSKKIPRSLYIIGGIFALILIIIFGSHRIKIIIN